ncbi:KH domain-containing protein [Bacillus carboniphilus]|uniref:RNA-binding protein KhpA n=1 Tax=Bacillus carboniphilus TaxID=86663 RepID=A0ABY9JY00_9BACI|nr:KH domain-containing protein [Bacillus carboniphilus]WLR44262.1 KH domain-containing protein [Bacillus carboniphilus]
MKELIETIAQSLVDFPDDVFVSERETEEKVTYTLSVHKEDVGKVIGKQGRVAKAMRTVVYAASNQSSKRVTLEIQD